MAKPVIVPKLLPIREQLGDAAIYYDPSNKDSLKDIIIAIVNNAIDLKELSRRAFRRALKFSWRAIALNTCKVYMSIYTRNKTSR